MSRKFFRYLLILVLGLVMTALTSRPYPVHANQPQQVLAQSSGPATTLFMVEEDVNDLNDILVKYESGNLVIVGNIGFADVRGLAYDATTDTLYGVSRASLLLLSIDRNTGAGTPVGTLPYLPADSNTAEISVNSTGSLLGLGHLDNQSAVDTLLSVDKITGVAAPLGNFGVSVLSGLAIDNSDTIYGTSFNGELYIIDPGGTSATSIGQITGANGGVARIAFDHTNNVLYGITFNHQLVTVDLNTLAATEVAQFSVPTQLYSMDFAASAPSITHVNIDIILGSRANTIDLKRDRLIPVAILSTPDFDAPKIVDRNSPTFGKTGDENSLAFCLKHGIKVNRDRLPDLVCYFHTSQTGFEFGDTEGILKGMTVENVSFEGSDSVKILKKSGH